MEIQPPAPELFQELQNRIAAADLEEYQAEILKNAQTGVALLLDGPPTGNWGGSRIGGAPDVPPGFEWPRDENGASAFLLQINLAEIPDFSENLLPKTGLLSFFIGLDEPASDVSHQIFWWEENDWQTPELPADEDYASEYYSQIVPHRLKFQVFADVPGYSLDEFEELSEELDGDQISALDDLARRPQEEIGQILGWAAGVGQDPRGDAFVVREHDAAWLYDVKQRQNLDFSGQKRWRNLLRVDSTRELDLNIWDAGFFSFLIHDDDLQKREFGRVYLSVETS